MAEAPEAAPEDAPLPTTAGSATRSTEADVARARILDAAAHQFRERGYDRVSLASIGGAIGLTGGAILYHFRSKANILEALLEPFRSDLDAALARLERAEPAATPREVLDAVLTLLTATRIAPDLLARDLAVRGTLGLDAWVAESVGRMIRLALPAGEPASTARIRGYAALGAMIRPLANLPGDILSSQEYETILSAAMGALGVTETATPERR